MPTRLPVSLWPLVQRLASGERWPPQDRAAADRFVWQAEREGLLPLLFDAQDLPVVLRDSLQGHLALERLYRRRSELLEDAFTVLAGLLEPEPAILLKGVDYRRRLYARPEHRPMQDIDVLVPIERCGLIVERLRRGGLQQRFPGGPATRLASYHERVLQLGEVTVEVHHSFVQRVRQRIDYGALWTRRVALEDAPCGLARLEDADAIAYHALSLAIDEFRVPLIRYVDLWLMLEAAPGALPEAAARARSWRAKRPLYGALRQLFLLLPESRSEARSVVAQSLLAAPTRAFLDLCVLPGEDGYGKGKNMSRAVELWCKCWLLDNAWRRARLCAYHAWASVAGRWLGADVAREPANADKIRAR